MLELLTEREKIIWLAPLIDGEGTVFLLKHTSKTKRGFIWKEGIRISSTNMKILEELKKFYSGRITSNSWKKEDKKKGWKTRHEFVFHVSTLRKIVPSLIEFSIIKKEHLILLNRALELLDRTKWANAKINPHEIELEKIWEKFRTLNKRGLKK